MCYTGENGWASVWNITWHVSRKRFRCCECGGPIPIGARYQRIFSVFDGEADTFHTHPECVALWEFAIVELCGDEGVREVGSLRDEISNYGGYGQPDDEPGLNDIVDAIREGYERQETTP